MIAAQNLDIGTVDSPPLAPSDQTVDLAHLFRMTLGDAKLEQEVLALFGRQIDLLIGRLNPTERAVAAGLAHTLCGSARGIGAWRVARAAEKLERAALTDSGDIQPGIDDLIAAAQETKAAIAALQSHR